MEMPKQDTIDSAIKLAGEIFLPGASLLMDGKVVIGGVHVVAGAWARAAFGPVGAALVIANSYTESRTGTSLLKHISQFAQDLQGGDKQSQAEPAATASPSQPSTASQSQDPSSAPN